MQEIKIKDLKNGDFFRLTNSETAPVWVRDSYDRSSRKYWVYKYEDINHGREVSPSRVVYTDFIY